MVTASHRVVKNVQVDWRNLFLKYLNISMRWFRMNPPTPGMEDVQTNKEPLDGHVTEGCLVCCWERDTLENEVCLWPRISLRVETTNRLLGVGLG